MRIYIAGPMRGKPFYNFVEFDATRDHLVALGHVVVSPADLDRDNGFDGMKCPPDSDWSATPPGWDMAIGVGRDLEALRGCSAIHLLPGWEESVGARAEAAVAEWMGLQRVDANGNSMPRNVGVRQFETGATRDLDGSKPDYEGFLAPQVLARFGSYMHRHRKTAAGLRASDNWQKGIPKASLIQSAFRHFMDWWSEHRGLASREGVEDALCGVLFNASAYLLALLKERHYLEREKHEG